MKNDSRINDPELWLEDLPAIERIRSFKSEELAICEKCGRKTPPSRADCFYCGNSLSPAAARKAAPEFELRKLESWEKGFNVVITKSRETIDSEKVAELSGFLRLAAEELERIINSNKFLPLARVESRGEAEFIAGKLAENGIESRIVADEQLRAETPVRRLRGIEFSNESLTLILFNNDEIAEIYYGDLSLIVVGAIFERRIESTESIKRREKGKVLDLNETGSDESVIDIYPRNDKIGYRIGQRGFDFSCLGKQKTLLAGENIKRLAEKLRENSSSAVFDEDYLKVRAELGKIWEVQEENSAGSVNRKSFGSFKRTNTTVISNLSQFTRYSRLQREIL